MWSSRSDESNSNDPSRANGTASGKEANRNGQAIGTVAFTAVVGKGMIIRGDVTSRESLYIEGELHGNLEMADHRLTVSREAKLGANVAAREIELMGAAQGDLQATSKITIRKGARLVGDLRAPGIVIEEGAYVKGRIEIVNSAAEEASSAPFEQKVRKAAAG